MKVFIVGDFSYGSLGLSYFNAFKKLGFETIQYDIVREFYSSNIFAKNRYLNTFCGDLLYKPVNKKLLNSIDLNKPDLVFVIKGYYVFPETLKEIKNRVKTILVNFNPDNPFNKNRAAANNLIKKSISLYDYCFIWGKFLIPALKNAGAKNVEYLPFAYDPDLHYPVQVESEEKQKYGNDIAFIGSWDEEREYWLGFLKGYNLGIWGNGWNKLKSNSFLKTFSKKEPVFGETFSKVCNSSKIILNLIREQNGNAHNMRTFEVPACKGFMLTTRTEEQCEIFTEGKDIACFNSPDELKEKIDQSLLKDEERKKMSLSGFEKIKNESYLKRAKTILETCLKAGYRL